MKSWFQLSYCQTVTDNYHICIIRHSHDRLWRSSSVNSPRQYASTSLYVIIKYIGCHRWVLLQSWQQSSNDRVYTEFLNWIIESWVMEYLAENSAAIYVVYTYTHNPERLTTCVMSTCKMPCRVRLVSPIGENSNCKSKCITSETMECRHVQTF